MVALLFLCAGFFLFVLPIPVIRFYPKSNDNICISLFVSRLEALYLGFSNLKYKGKGQRIRRIKPFPYFWILQDTHPHTLNGISLLLSVQNITASDRKAPCPPSFKETAEGSQRSMLEV